ncbi:MAG: hypothetical protein ACI3VA_10075 [Candidatus Limivicinus sp.]
MFACGAQKYTLYAQSVFPDVHAAGKNGFEFVFGQRAENDKSFVYSLKSTRMGAFQAVCVLMWYFPPACAVILIPDKNIQRFPAKFMSCGVGFLDHSSPLCSAKAALPDTNFARKSNKAFYLGLV